MATGMVLMTAFWVAVIVSTTGNLALFAFRPGSYRTAPWGRQVMGIITAVWVIVLPVGGAILLGLGADALASNHRAPWQDIVTGGVALACWPVVILAVRKRRATYRNP